GIAFVACDDAVDQGHASGTRIARTADSSDAGVIRRFGRVASVAGHGAVEQAERPKVCDAPAVRILAIAVAADRAVDERQCSLVLDSGIRSLPENTILADG